MMKTAWKQGVLCVVMMICISVSAQASEGLKSDDPATRAMTARSIAETGQYGEGDIELLIRCLGDFTRLIPRGVVSMSVEFARDPRETSPSEEAEKALVHIGKPAVPKLLEALTQEKDEWRLYTIVRCLGDIGDPSALPSLKQLTEPEHYHQHYNHAGFTNVPIAIAKIARQEAYDLVFSIYQDADKKRVTQMSGFIESLGYTQDERILPLFQELLSKGDRYVILDVLIALGYSSLEGAIPLLVPYVNSEDGHMKDYAREALKRLGREDLIPQE